MFLFAFPSTNSKSKQYFTKKHQRRKTFLSTFQDHNKTSGEKKESGKRITKRTKKNTFLKCIGILKIQTKPCMQSNPSLFAFPVLHTKQPKTNFNKPSFSSIWVLLEINSKPMSTHKIIHLGEESFLEVKEYWEMEPLIRRTR